jgi:hypothetical protein
MIRSILLAAVVLIQVVLLLAAGVATVVRAWDLMPWVIHMVGEDRAVGPSGVISFEDGREMLDNPDGMFGWTVAILSLGFAQVTAAIILFWLWWARLTTRRARQAAALVMLLGMVALGVIVTGCSGPPPAARTLAQAGRILLYEGLPHPMYEPRVLESEKKSKPTVDLHGFPFYRELLELKPGDVERLKALLGDPATFRPYSGEKKCGGFHPDYAVEWSAGDTVYRSLICFGCFEAKLYGPEGGTTYDVGRDVQDRFEALLQPYRKNRPPYRPTE